MRRWPALSVLVLALGCGVTYSASSRVVHAGSTAFRVGPLGEGWARVLLDHERVVFHHADGGSISASAVCGSSDDAPLAVLTNHLLIGMDRRQVLSQVEHQLDGRAALESRIAGRLDGVPVNLAVVVMKKDGCVYDVQLVGDEATVQRHAGDFATFWQGLATVAR